MTAVCKVKLKVSQKKQGDPLEGCCRSPDVGWVMLAWIRVIVETVGSGHFRAMFSQILLMDWI